MGEEFDVMENQNVVDTMKETDRKCPCCGGTMDFDPMTGGLYCPYCDHREEIAHQVTEPEKASEISLEDAENIENCNWGIATKMVICKSCGAESVYDMQEISAVCPYCGSNQVMEAGDEHTMAPGGVVPFAIDAKTASSRFMAWLKSKFFAPKAAKNSVQPDKFKGMYLPYWTFDSDTYSTYTAEYGKDRYVKNRDGSEKTVTDWFRTSGTYSQFINDELVCGTTQHDPGLLGGVAPYNTEDNKAYKPEYVAGFGAERYTVGVKEAWEKAKQFIKSKLNNAIASVIRSEHNADHVRNLNVNTTFTNVTFKYLLLPVWVSSFKYKDKVYKFMVNGQTGRVSGTAPVSVPKVILTILVIIAVIALIRFFALQ